MCTVKIVNITMYSWRAGEKTFAGRRRPIHTDENVA